jgi:predicted MFS family arabinose efflux permease
MRVFQGVAFGIVTTVVSTLVADLLPDARRGEGIGYFGLGNVLMAALAPALGLILMESFGFPSTFLTASAGQLITIVLTCLFRPDPALLAPSAPAKSEPKPSIIERIYDKSLALQTVLLTLFGMVRTAEMNYMPLLAKQRSISHLPVFYICQTTASFFARFAAANLYDRKGKSFVIVPSSLLLIVSLVFFSFAENLPVLIAGAVCNGAGLGMLQPAIQTWCVNAVAPPKRAVANAVFYNFYDLGITCFSPLLGIIAHHFNYGSIYVATIIPAALFFIIYCACVKRQARHLREAENE